MIQRYGEYPYHPYHPYQGRYECVRYIRLLRRFSSSARPLGRDATKEEVSNALETFGSWYGIAQPSPPPVTRFRTLGDGL